MVCFITNFVSIPTFFLVIMYNFSENTRKVSTFNSFIYSLSLLSPLSLFLVYYFNLCLAHNLFKTFFSYKNSYDKRMKVYKIFALLLSIVIFILSIIFNNQNENKVLVMAYYNVHFVAVFYTFGLVSIIYIIYIVMNIMTNDSNVAQEGIIDKKKEILNLFIKKQITFLTFFVLCYLPNNIIVLAEVIFKTRISSKDLSFVIYLLSLSCLISIIIKLTDPYTKKYFKNIYYLIFKSNALKYPVEEIVDNDINQIYEKILNSSREHHLSPLKKGSRSFKDISKTKTKLEKSPFVEGQAAMIELIDKKETRRCDSIKLKVEDESKVDLEIMQEPSYVNPDLIDYSKQGSINYLSTMVYGMENYVIERLKEEYLFRFKGMVLSLDEEKIYDTSPIYLEKTYEKLPWKSKFYYEESTDFKEYNYKNCPLYSQESNEKYRGVSIQLKKYAPLVFHIIRKIDGIKLEEYKESLSPMKNKDKITQSFASGGNSDNPIIFTHDRKYLLKSISRSEKEMLMKILPEYHLRMKEAKTFLCRVYGLYSIMINNKEQAYVIVMKNMCDLPGKLKVVSFDIKGSSVNRSELTFEERKMVNNGKVADVISGLKNRVLKDTDFKELGIRLLLSKKDYDFLFTYIKEDITFLCKKNIHDYSILINIHQYNEEEYSKFSNNYRVFKSTDQSYIYSFSIIDFITEYDIMRKGEKTVKMIFNFHDTNFSCQNPQDYYERLLEHIKNNLFDVKE